MTCTKTLFPDAVLLQHACRGFALTTSTVFLDTAADLGELHASRFTSTVTHGLAFHRKHLVHKIDREVLAACVPRPQATLADRVESVGVVVDQIAQCCAVAFRAPLSMVRPDEIEDAYHVLNLICTDYDALVSEIAAGIAIPPINRHRQHARPLSYHHRADPPH